MGRIRTKNWFAWMWRSLFGYTVSFMTVDKEYRVKHRFLRSPIMTKHILPQGLSGMKYTAIFFDESSEWPPKSGKLVG